MRNNVHPKVDFERMKRFEAAPEEGVMLVGICTGGTARNVICYPVALEDVLSLIQIINVLLFNIEKA